MGVGMTADDEEWFASLYETCYRRLVLIVLAGTRDLAEAEEVVQEAFVTAYAKRDTVRAADNPEAWICTVALNVGRRRWRRRGIADRLSGRAQDSAPADLGDVRAENADLYQAIRALPVAQREAVFLHHLADLPVEEIAVRVGVPIGTVKSRLARGRTALAGQLGLALTEKENTADQPTAREGSSSS